MSWSRTLLWFLFWFILAAIAQYCWDTSAGWILVTLACGIILTLRRHQANRVAVWATHPETDPPAGVGQWEDMVASLYRHLRGRAMALRNLQQTNDAVMSAAQALPIGTVTLTKDFQIRWFNEAAKRTLHLKSDQDIGQNLLNLLRSPLFVAYTKQTRWQEPVILKLSLEGNNQSIMMRLVPYADDQLLLITRDLTHIEKLETTRRDFVANVSHEMRTPLTVLSGFLETMLEAPKGALSPEQTHHYLKLMHEQALRMEALVADLLTLSALETSLSADRDTIQMAPLIESARQQAEILSGGRHNFNWAIEPDLNLLGNQTELSSAITNLLTNAVRYTPDGQSITVRWCSQPDGSGRYSVTDTGIGIASEHLPRLSERFYTVDRGRSRALGGTGLGLAITKHVAMRHDAQLEIQSKLGQGSTFSLVFAPDRVLKAS
jgi:two-component system phosphate regulon sensor histidine kinase PhoR